MDEQFLVFDLETVGLPLDAFDSTQQEYLLRGAATDEDRDRKINEFALSPLTGRIVCIGMQLVTPQADTTLRQVAYMLDPSMEDLAPMRESVLPSGATVYYGSERTMLENWWKLLASKKNVSLISFNGRNFDAPWLMLRSAALRIRPSKNIMDGTRFSYSNHIDLLDKLTYYNGQNSGALRRFNFDFYAKSFGITSPKAAGVDGSKVGQLFDAGEYETIADYCLRDVASTWDLYLYWNSYLRF
jgi:3'-5' exonuclease